MLKKWLLNLRNHRRERLRRRTTFLKMFLKGMILPVLITLILGNYIAMLNYHDTIEYAEAETAFFAEEFATVLGKDVSPAYMSKYFTIDKDLSYGKLNPRTWFSPKIRTVAFTFDSSGNIIDSNRPFMNLKVYQKYDNNPDEYYFDPQEYDLPELQRLFADAAEFSRSNEKCLVIDVLSAWLNEAEGKMIPKEMDVKIRTRAFNPFWLFTVASDSLHETDSYHISVDFEPEGYVLTKKYILGESPNTDPHIMEAEIIGSDTAYIAQVAAEYQKQIADFMTRNSSYAYLGGDGLPHSYNVSRLSKLTGSKDMAGYFTFAETILDTPHAWRRLNIVLGSLLFLITVIVAVVCAFRNAKNKAQYAFEDYQRALTNNLAHDLKTPLAVIGGYAENLLEMRRDGDETEREYLQSIMKNVAFTDEIIQKTLRLNETEQIRLHKTDTDIRQLAATLAEKYRTALTERGITLTVSGSGTVTADAELLTETAENLISNAVKYTPDGGNIRITADRKQLRIENDVPEDIDTKNLMMPFVKGDKARSDRRSSGLGLAIAKTAAEQNGFTLKISCKSSVFTAELIF